MENDIYSTLQENIKIIVRQNKINKYISIYNRK